MHQPTVGMLTDFAYAQWKQAEDSNGEELPMHDPYTEAIPAERLPVKNHGRIVGSKVMRPESYDLTFGYYVQDPQSEPIQGARSSLLPRSVYSLTFETESGSETLQDGHRVGNPDIVYHGDGTSFVTDTFRFQKRS